MVTTRLLSNKGEGGSRGIYHPHWVSIKHFLIPFLNLGLSGGSGVGRGAKGGPKWSRLVLVVENMLGIDILGGKFSGVIFTPQNKGICKKFKG